MTYSGQSPIIGLFIEPVRTELNLDRAQIALLYLVATTTSALLLPLMGRLIDRFGVQIVVSGVTTGLGFAYFYSQRCSRSRCYYWRSSCFAFLVKGASCSYLKPLSTFGGSEEEGP